MAAPTQSRAARSAGRKTVRVNLTPKKPVDLELGDETYVVKPPKMSVILAIAQHSESTEEPGAIARDFDNIIATMFGKNATRIRERLADPEDELDYDHIFEAIEGIAEDDAGDPTSSSRD
jgi:hypothetical protein